MVQQTSVRVVLVVDDDERVLASFGRAFASAGKRVFTASHAAIARRIAKEQRPDLALVDLRLDGAWGLDLIADLKTDTPDLEIALVSAFVGADVALAALRLGANHVFLKPVTCSKILKQIEAGVPAVEPKRGEPTLADVEREHIMRVLHATKGNLSETARRLGIRRSSLQKRFKKLGAAS